MPVPKSEFDDLRSLEFRDPDEVLDDDEMYTVYEIARLFQGLEPGQELDPATEDILLDWTIPWMLDNSEAFVFAEPADDDEPGHYGLATGETPVGGTDGADADGE
jgi:hypothetical protein